MRERTEMSRGRGGRFPRGRSEVHAPRSSSEIFTLRGPSLADIPPIVPHDGAVVLPGGGQAAANSTVRVAGSAFSRRTETSWPGGGPPSEDQSVAGATDILISYTYKLAFEAGKGQDYGLASAVSIAIFFVVAGISAISFWRTKSLENLA